MATVSMASITAMVNVMGTAMVKKKVSTDKIARSGLRNFRKRSSPTKSVYILKQFIYGKTNIISRVRYG